MLPAQTTATNPPNPSSHLERFLEFYFSHPAFSGEPDPWLRFVALASSLRKEKAEAQKTNGNGSKPIHSFPMEGNILRSELRDKLTVIGSTNQKSLYDCFYVANMVRRNMGSKSCENSDVVRRLFLPLDFDYRLPCSIGELLGEFGLGAAAIVQTSMREGYPRYQILFSLDATEKQDEISLGVLAQRMCQVFGSDVVHDAKRILRLPGTVNWKGGASGSRDGRLADSTAKLPSKTVPLVTWCKIIDGLGGLVPENIWAAEEVSECVEKFADGALSLELMKLSREHSMTKEAVAAGRKQESAAKKRKSGAKEKDNSEFGWWEDALKLAEKGKASVLAGARHPAMASWMGQMLRGGIIVPVVVKNMRLLAEKACSPSFVGDDDFLRMLRQYVEKYRGKLADEVKQGFINDPTEGANEPTPKQPSADNEGEERTPQAAREKKETTNEERGEDDSLREDEGNKNSRSPAAESDGERDTLPVRTAGGEANGPGEALPVEEQPVSSGVASTIKDLEEREQVAILQFRDHFFDWLFTKEAFETGRYEKELVMLVMAVQQWRISKDETLFIDFFEGAFKRVNCFIGNYCSARAEVVTPWGSRAVSRAPMNEAELLAVVDSCVRKLVAGLKKHGDKLAALKSIAAAMGEELTEKEQRKVSLRVSGVTRLVGSIATGMSRRLGGSFGRLDTQPRRVVVFQNGVFDLESGKFREELGAAIRYSNPVQARYVEASPSASGSWSQFMERAFPSDEGTLELIYRIIGYMMTVDTSAQKIFWFEGVSGSGKSSLAGVMLAILGQRNITSTRIQLAAGDFGLGMCEGKTICLIEEAENADPKIRNNAFGRLKEASSGNSIVIQQKFKDERTAVLPTKFLLLSNKDLGLDDSGGGTLRRLVPIKFERVVPVDEVRPDEELRAEILSEADSIASESARRLSSVWKRIGSAFDVAGSLALARGKEDTRAQLAGVSVILGEILEPCDVEIGHVPLPSTLVKQVVIAVAEEIGVSLKAGRADKILKDVRTAMDSLGATHSESSRPSGHHSKKYNGYSGVRFKRAVWERGLAWGKILAEIDGHARFAAELLCRANEISDAEIDAKPGTPALVDEPIGILE